MLKLQIKAVKIQKKAEEGARKREALGYRSLPQTLGPIQQANRAQLLVGPGTPQRCQDPQAGRQMWSSQM